VKKPFEKIIFLFLVTAAITTIYLLADSLLPAFEVKASETFTAKISKSANDHTQVEYSNGAYFDLGEKNPLYAGKNSKGYRYYTALRFENIQIPQGAVIRSAHLRLSPAWWQEKSGSLLISAQKAANSQPLGAVSQGYKIKQMPRTQHRVSWNISQAWGSRGYQESPDLKDIISELIDQTAGWQAGNSLTIYLEGKDSYWTFDSYDTNPQEAAELLIDYESVNISPTPTPPGQPVEKTIALKIEKPEDDTYQLYGYAPRSANYLRIGHVYQAGFRFNSVDIPPGVRILEARLQLASPWYHEGSPSTVKICGEASGNSAPLSVGELRSRPITTCIDWPITGPWKTKQYQESVDLSYIIQEIVSRADWQRGNSLTLLTKENYQDYWPVVPFEADPAKAARLTISYQVYQSLPAPTPTATPQPTTSPVPSPTLTPIPTPPPTGSLIQKPAIGYSDQGQQVAACHSKITVDKVAGAAISKLEYYVDNALKKTEESDRSQYIFYWDSSSVSDGQHRLKVVAYNSSGGQDEKTVSFYTRNAGLNDWWQKSLEEIKKMKSRTSSKTVPLMFHLFSENQKDEDTVTYDQFYCLLTNLESEGYRLVNLDEFYQIEQGSLKLNRPILVTMDDIQTSQWKALEDVLSQFGFKALLAAPVDWIGKPNHFSKDQLKQLSNQGYDIQSHTYHHYRLTRLSQEDLIFELSESKKFLENLIGRPVSAIVYPFGAINDTVKQKVAEAGYRSGFVVDNYWRSSDLYSVARVFIKGKY
jgi:peptidoglycan/xylan/chitin deacetylase (PgdA/CDA1 family)